MSKEEILQAAALIFQQKGYHATSMQDIADAVDLQKGSLYHHVDSKQDILFALLNKALELILERLQFVADQDIPPEQKIRQATRAYFSFLAIRLLVTPGGPSKKMLSPATDASRARRITSSRSYNPSQSLCNNSSILSLTSRCVISHH